MATLAIRGHATRGKEVIEILEMLGGNNKNGWECKNPQLAYYIDNGLIEFINNCNPNEDILRYTLEKFLEKYPYKVGDKVRLPDYESAMKIEGMKWDGYGIVYEVYTDDYEWFSVEELNAYNEPYKEQEPMSVQKTMKQITDIAEKLIKIDIPKGYEFARVDNQQVVFEKVKPQYPKTYEECCEYIGCDDKIKMSLIGQFTKLINARNSYWKLAGEQMGLGKPWEPDWSTEDEIKYVIEVYRNNVRTNSQGYSNTILAFPTAEMRDAFYENFKKLIETCKELL